MTIHAIFAAIERERARPWDAMSRASVVLACERVGAERDDRTATSVPARTRRTNT